MNLLRSRLEQTEREMSRLLRVMDETEHMLHHHHGDWAAAATESVGEHNWNTTDDDVPHCTPTDDYEHQEEDEDDDGEWDSMSEGEVAVTASEDEAGKESVSSRRE